MYTLIVSIVMYTFTKVTLTVTYTYIKTNVKSNFYKHVKYLYKYHIYIYKIYKSYM